jgi:tight adherence protein C
MGGFLVVLLGFLFIVGAVLVVLASSGVLAPGGTAVQGSLRAIDSYGQHNPVVVQETPEPSFFDRVVLPLLGRAVVLGRRVTPAENAARIRHMLDVAGNPPGWTIDRVISMKVVGFAVGIVLSLAFTSYAGVGTMPKFVVCVASALGGYVAVNVWLQEAGKKRTAQMQAELPDAVDLLTISVEAGLGFDSALGQVARNTEGPVAQEFARVLQEIQIGMGRAQAMRALGERTTLPELRSFSNALAQADAFGIPIGNVLRVQSAEMRVKRRQRAEESAQKVAVKVLFPLMFCILPTLFLIVLGPTVIHFLQAVKK